MSALYVINQTPSMPGAQVVDIVPQRAKDLMLGPEPPDAFILDVETARVVSDLCEAQVDHDHDWENNLIILEDELQHGDQVIGVQLIDGVRFTLATIYLED